MVRAEIINVGSELTRGNILNTNAQFLSARLTDIGASVEFQTSCRDELYSILQVLHTALCRTDLVIVTGGLGSTPDDLTREAVAKFFQTRLKFNREQFRRTQTYFRKIHQRNRILTKQEFCFPEMAKPILNRVGIALGFYIETESKFGVILPGVPREMESMFESSVVPLIKRKYRQLMHIRELAASITGLTEPEVMKRLGARFFRRRDFEFGIYPMEGMILIRLRSRNQTLLRRLKRDLKRNLGIYLYSFQEEPIEETIARWLKKRGISISVAESCTGGLLGKRLTDVAGASAYFLGGVVAYHDRIKREVLSVSPVSLKRFGAVSQTVARQMAQEIRLKFGSSIGISVTGIAGPTGGSVKKPVGLVWIGLADRTRVFSERYMFAGSRTHIRQRAAQKVLWFLYLYLRKKFG